jgi:hypothetical protein
MSMPSSIGLSNLEILGTEKIVRNGNNSLKNTITLITSTQIMTWIFFDDDNDLKY